MHEDHDYIEQLFFKQMKALSVCGSTKCLA